ncbi:MAG: NlpC/P60 family protein [Parolsenella sp.]|uniref:C40 family peptidase n=1 Tax=Parolsenella sp. TaxID=2083006 RepID=UPI002E785C86|nr:NlpC/P60 family protein [Parolsenella sp.]MEE1372310.1 NlpC/P60 family protein [Parolsenella sp.]
MTRKTASKLLAAALAASISVTGVGLALPTVALADESSAELQAKLDSAKATLDDLYGQAEEASEKLNDTKYKLEQTNKSIEQTKKDIKAKQDELKQAQATLSDRVSANYKSGGVSLLELVLQSSSFEELANNIYYAQKVSASDEKAIDTVRTVQAELNKKQASLEKDKKEQEKLVADQQSQADELNAKAQAAQTYVDGLDSKVQAKLKEEQEAAHKKAEEEARKNQSKAEEEIKNNNGGNSGGGSHSSNNGGNHSSNNGGGNSGGGSHSGGNSGGGGISSNARSTIVSTAYSLLGKAYVWGASGPNAYDCSGLVQACYGAAGIYVPHSSGALSAYCNKPASQAVAGDIVWRSGHVGICIGGGQTIEAMSPSQGVTYGSIYTFTSAGSPA